MKLEQFEGLPKKGIRNRYSVFLIHCWLSSGILIGTIKIIDVSRAIYSRKAIITAPIERNVVGQIFGSDFSSLVKYIEFKSQQVISVDIDCSIIFLI